MEKREPLYTVTSNGSAAVENSMEFSQKTTNKTTMWPSNSALGYILKKKEGKKNTNSKRYMSPQIHSSII